MLAFCNAAAAAEALMIGKRSGIDLRKLDQVIRNASGFSTGYANMATKALAGNFQATFALDLAHKDLRLALELADELGVPGMIAPQVMTLMRMARGMGLGSSDSASVIRVYETALNTRCGGKLARVHLTRAFRRSQPDPGESTRDRLGVAFVDNTAVFWYPRRHEGDAADPPSRTPASRNIRGDRGLAVATPATRQRAPLQISAGVDRSRGMRAALR